MIRISRDDHLQQRYRTTIKRNRDNVGTIRMGYEWFNRYQLNCWESEGFQLVDLK